MKMDGWDVWAQGFSSTVGNFDTYHLISSTSPFRHQDESVTLADFGSAHIVQRMQGFAYVAYVVLSFQFQRSDTRVHVRSRIIRSYLYKGAQMWLVEQTRSTKVRWIIIFSTWPLSSARLKARVLLDMNASLIREIILPSLNSWEGQHRRFLIVAAVQNFTESSNRIWGWRRCYYRRREFPQGSKFFSKDDPNEVI